MDIPNAELITSNIFYSWNKTWEIKATI